jgi:hypothetical protein
MNCPICNYSIIEYHEYNFRGGNNWWCYHILKRYGIGFANKDGGFTYIYRSPTVSYTPDLILKGIRVLDDDQIDKYMMLR